MSLLRALVPAEVVEFFNQVNRVIGIIPGVLIVLTVSAVLYDWVTLFLSYYHYREWLQLTANLPAGSPSPPPFGLIHTPGSSTFAAQLLRSVVVGLVGFIISFIIREAFLWFYSNSGGNAAGLGPASPIAANGVIRAAGDMADANQAGEGSNNGAFVVLRFLTRTLRLTNKIFLGGDNPGIRALMSLAAAVSATVVTYVATATPSTAASLATGAVVFVTFEVVGWRLHLFRKPEEPPKFDSAQSAVEQFEWDEGKFNKVLNEVIDSEELPPELDSAPEASSVTGPLTLEVSLSSKAHVVIAVLGEVKCGKTSLLKALFSVDPADTTSTLGKSLVVNSIFHSPRKEVCQVVRLQNDVVLLDLPGLHALNSSEVLKRLLKPGLLDVAIFVVSRAVTNTMVEDYREVCRLAKKVMVVYNKIDELDYLKGKDHIISQWKETLGIDQIFLTASKGYDPDADRSSANWLDIRGVDALRDAILGFLKTSKRELLFSKHMMVKNRPATDIILNACVNAFFQTFLSDSAVRVTATHINALSELHVLYMGKRLNRRLAEQVLLSTSDSLLSQSLYYFAKTLIPAPSFLVDIVTSVVSAGSVIGKTASVLIAAQQLLQAKCSLLDPRLPMINQNLQLVLLPKIRSKLVAAATSGGISSNSSIEAVSNILRGTIEETMAEDHIGALSLLRS